MARTYSNSHLMAHPGQLPLSIIVVLDQSSGTNDRTGDPILTARVGMRIQSEFWETGTSFCDSETARGVLQCGPVDDGGRFDLERTPSGDIYLTNHSFRIYKIGGDGEYFRIPNDRENTILALQPVPRLD